MTPGSLMNPHTSLPFEMFRAFGPKFEEHRPNTVWTPPCDVYGTDKEIVLTIKLPEMRNDNVEVTLKNNVLTIRCERK